MSKHLDTNMTEGSIFRQLLFFSLPLLAGNFFQQCYNTVDSIVLGNFVGKAALAAVGTTTPIINTLIGLFLGLSAGIGVVISQFYGAKEEEKVGQAVQTGLLLVLLLCAVSLCSCLAPQCRTAALRSHSSLSRRHSIHCSCRA